MLFKVEYKNCKDIIRDWLWVKYHVLNNGPFGTRLGVYDGKPELVYDHVYPGAALFFDDIKFKKMKMAGYFVGHPGRYMGEGGTVITDKAVEEILIERKRFDEERQRMLEDGFKLFMDSESIKKEIFNATEYYNRSDFRLGEEWELSVDRRRRYLSEIYELYLIPETEVENIEIGSVLVSSVDAEEIIYNGKLDWEIQEGFSIYGVRLMPVYVDELLLENDNI